MMELISMLRPLATWHFLLAICLLDTALILVHLSGGPPYDAELDTQRRLHEVLAEHALVSRSVRDKLAQLKLLQEEAEVKAERLMELSRGVDHLETAIGKLMGSNSKSNSSSSPAGGGS